MGVEEGLGVAGGLPRTLEDQRRSSLEGEAVGRKRPVGGIAFMLPVDDLRHTL